MTTATGTPEPPRPAAPDPAVYDPLSGIVKRCFELALEPGDPRVFCFVSEATRTERFGTGAPACARYGCGVGPTREWAAAAAVGEVLERYAGALYDPAGVRHGSYAELGGDAVAPESFALFSEAQYAQFAREARSGERKWMYHPFTSETRTGWVPGYSLVRSRPVLVPAAMVYLPYVYAPGEPYVVDSLSTGMACARTRDQATLGALCEVVERDAVSIAWHNRLALPRVDGEGLPGERFACRGARYELLDATLDVAIPTVVAVFIDERGGTAVASATRPSPAEAARKALLEAAQCRVAWKRDLVLGAPARFAPDFHDVVDFADHGRVYTLREMRPHLEFLWSGERRVPLAELPDASGDGAAASLRNCVERLAARGLEPIALDLTTDDLREAGYWVVRVVIPGMQPMNARHDSPFLGGRRLREVPWRLGLRPRPAREDELNRMVHPFP